MIHNLEALEFMSGHPLGAWEAVCSCYDTDGETQTGWRSGERETPFLAAKAWREHQAEFVPVSDHGTQPNAFRKADALLASGILTESPVPQTDAAIASCEWCDAPARGFVQWQGDDLTRRSCGEHGFDFTPDRPARDEREAEAWDEGHNAGWNSRNDDAVAGWMPSGPHESDAKNPYRSEVATTGALDSLFPGTQEALDALTIRKEADQ